MLHLIQNNQERIFINLIDQVEIVITEILQEIEMFSPNKRPAIETSI